MNPKSKKFSTMIFLVALFFLLSVLVGAWLYKIFKEQTSYSNDQTLATIDCGRYYFYIPENSVKYQNGTLEFDIENTLGKEIEQLTLRTALEKKTLNMTGLTQGTKVPVKTPIAMTDWVYVYPDACDGVNYKNISFLPAEEGNGRQVVMKNTGEPVKVPLVG